MTKQTKEFIYVDAIEEFLRYIKQEHELRIILTSIIDYQGKIQAKLDRCNEIARFLDFTREKYGFTRDKEVEFMTQKMLDKKVRP